MFHCDDKEEMRLTHSYTTNWEITSVLQCCKLKSLHVLTVLYFVKIIYQFDNYDYSGQMGK